MLSNRDAYRSEEKENPPDEMSPQLLANLFTKPMDIPMIPQTVVKIASHNLGDTRLMTRLDGISLAISVVNENGRQRR